MTFDSTSVPVPDLAARRQTTRTPQNHYEEANRLLWRADELLGALDRESWFKEDEGALNETLVELDLVTRLAQAHATLGASR